jgi:hypothetical protein
VVVLNNHQLRHLPLTDNVMVKIRDKSCMFLPTRHGLALPQLGLGYTSYLRFDFTDWAMIGIGLFFFSKTYDLIPVVGWYTVGIYEFSWFSFWINQNSTLMVSLTYNKELGEMGSFNSWCIISCTDAILTKLRYQYENLDYIKLWKTRNVL